MREKQWLVIVAALALVALVGCATIQPGADPVLVRAEQALVVSFETVDAFLRIERENQHALDEVVPGAHAVAESMRTRGPASFRALEAAITAYRAHRTPERRATLITWLAVCEQLAHDAQAILAAWGGGAR